MCSQGEGRSAKAFTPYALMVNALTQVGEAVKAKNEKCLTRARRIVDNLSADYPITCVPTYMSYLL